MLARLPLNDEVIDALALLLEAECLHRDSLAQSRRLKLAKLGQRAHPADVDLRNPRGLGKTRWQQMLSLNWLKQHQHLLLTRSEEHTSELQSLMRISYAVFCLKNKISINQHNI